jgi:hypothetical protein
MTLVTVTPSEAAFLCTAFHRSSETLIVRVGVLGVFDIVQFYTEDMVRKVFKLPTVSGTPPLSSIPTPSMMANATELFC